MAKAKRGKSGSATEMSRWELELTQAQLNEESWKSMIIFISPNAATDIFKIKTMSEVAMTGLRKLFSIVDYDLLLQEVKELASHGKAGKGKVVSKPPQFVEICDQVKVVLDQGEVLSASVLAKLIKFKMLSLKQKDIERRNDERKAADAAAKQTQKSDDRSRSRQASGKRAKSQSPGKKKGKKDERPPSPKKDTKLKHRGEVEDTFKTLDDEPDGPNDPYHYLLITGFYDPKVAQSLTEMHVFPDANFILKSDIIPEPEIVETNESSEQIETTADQQPNEENEQEKRELEEKIHKLKLETDSLIKNLKSGHPLKNMPNIEVILHEELAVTYGFNELEGEPRTGFGTKVFNEVSQECYKLIDYKIQYSRYLDSLELINIPDSLHAAEKDGSNFPLQPEVDMRYYKKLMDSIPSEKQSPKLLLHCLLEQVSVAVDGPTNTDCDDENNQEPSAVLESYIEEQLGKFTYCSDKKNSDEVHPSTQHKPPTVLYSKDSIRERLIDVSTCNSDVDIMTVESSMLKHHPFSQLVKALNLEMDEKVKISSRNQQVTRIWQQKTNLVSAEPFWRGVQRLLFEALPIQTVDEYGDIVDPDIEKNMLITYLDDPFFGLKHKEDTLKLDYGEMDFLRNLENWTYVEPYQSDTMIQVLADAAITHPFIDTHFHKATGALLIILHNPSGTNCQSKISWDTWVHSNVGFRNYLEHIADYVDDWQRELEAEEEKRLAEIASEKIPEPVPSPEPLKPENRNRMLTRQEILDVKAAEEEKGKKKGKKGSGKKSARSQAGSKLRPGSKTAGNRTPSARSSKSRAHSAKKKAGTGKGKHENVETEKEENAGEVQEEQKTYQFQGYDIGDELIHISGSESYAFPGNGGLIKVEKYSYVQGNTTVRTCLFKNGNTFVFHCRNPVENQDPENHETEESQPGNPDKKCSTPEIYNQSFETSKTTVEIGTATYEAESYNPTFELPKLPYLLKPISESSCLVFQYSDGFVFSMAAAVSQSLYQKRKAIYSKLEFIESGHMEDKTNQNSLTTAVSTQHTKAGSPKGRKKIEDELKRQEELEKAKEQERRRLVVEIKKEIQELQDAISQLQNLNMTCPDGLHISFVVLSSVADGKNNTRRVIRQHFPEIKEGNHKTVTERAAVALKEKARCITQDGQIIRLMKDESVEVFTPDGSIIKAIPCTLKQTTTEDKATPEPNSEVTGNVVRVSSKRMSRTPIMVKEATIDVSHKTDRSTNGFTWEIIEMDGTKSSFDEDGQRKGYRSLLTSMATCPKTQQIIETREDGFSVVRRPDGTRIIEHTDGTRITVYSLTDQTYDQETGEKKSPEACLSNAFIKAECLGYATVVADTKNGLVKVLFGEGSSVTSFNEGSYSIERPNEGLILIDKKGSCLYTQDTSMEFDGKMLFDDRQITQDSYLLQHASYKCLSTTNHNGHAMSCMSNGNISFPSEGNQEALQDSTTVTESLDPRFFILYPDGSGEERLRTDYVDDYLKKVEKESNSAILSSDIENYPSAKGITVIKPFKGSINSRWLRVKDEQDIMPVGLKERDFSTFPSKKERMLGPPPSDGVPFFLQDKKQSQSVKPIIACPPVLELRHFIKQPSLTEEMKRTIFDILNEYSDTVAKRNHLHEGLQPSEPRSEEEINASRDLLTKTFEILNKEEGQAFIESHENNVENAYIDAITSPPSPPPVKAQPRRPASEWEKDRIEVAEINYAKDCLKHGIVPPYFDTEKGQAFLNEQRKEKPDLMALSAQLARQTLHPNVRPASSDSDDCAIKLDQNESNLQESHLDSLNSTVLPGDHSLSEIQSSLVDNLTPSKIRPENPTPNARQGHTLQTDIQSPAVQFTSTPLQPQQKPPVVTPERLEEALNDSGEGYTTAKEQGRGEIPRSVRGSRPGALRNDKFMEIEDPVRRTIKTASVAGSVNPDSTSHLRGFILIPDFIDFGVLREGFSYVHDVELKNVGIDICRFKIKQPPPSTGLRVNFEPGPVAAGMSTTIQLELFAVAVGVEGHSGIGSIAHHVEIITETYALYLPVVATILTAYEYENPSLNCPKGGPSPGTLQLKQRPLSRESLNRPRKYESS